VVLFFSRRIGLVYWTLDWITWGWTVWGDSFARKDRKDGRITYQLDCEEIKAVSFVIEHTTCTLHMTLWWRIFFASFFHTSEVLFE